MTRTLDELRTEVLYAVQAALARPTTRFTAYAGGEWYAAPDVPGVRLKIEWRVEEAATSSQLSHPLMRVPGGAAVAADEEGAG